MYFSFIFSLEIRRNKLSPGLKEMKIEARIRKNEESCIVTDILSENGYFCLNDFVV